MLTLIILDGVEEKLGTILQVNEFGVEQTAILCAPSACPPLLGGLRPGNPGQYEGVEVCPYNANGVAAL